MLPNFLVIGAGRSGTTSLHHYLGQHPEVYISKVKSPSHFFCQGRVIRDASQLNYFIPDPKKYEALFQGVDQEKAVGEVSPVYLAALHVAPTIARQLPEVKLCGLLRNPIDRAWARYVARLRDGLEQRTMEQILADEISSGPLCRADASGTYLASGCCGHFLKSYYDHFPAHQIRVDLFEDLVRDPLALMSRWYEFLGVSPDFSPNVTHRYNQSGGKIRNPALRTIWTTTAPIRTRLRKYLPQSLRDRVFRLFTREVITPTMSPELREQLGQLFREDTLRLQDLIGRDLSAWMRSQ